MSKPDDVEHLVPKSCFGANGLDIRMLNGFGNEKITQKANAQGRRCSGFVEVSPHKNVDGYGIIFPEQCSCSGGRPAKQGLSLSKQTAHRTGGKGWLCRHTSSPGLTLTGCRTVGRQGAPSPRTSYRLVAMPCRRPSSCSRRNLSRQAGRGGACMDLRVGTSNLATSR